MNGELISVIVPVYNVENYVTDCIESLLCQTYKNIEIILVDDGSTDSSAKICDSFAKNPIIRVYHKVNGGLSDARNFGIKKSNGKYLLFVDSDDTIENDIVEYLYMNLLHAKSDISICPHKIICSNSRVVQNTKYDNAIFNRKDAIIHLLLDKEFSSSACSKLFKKELFSDIEFPVGKIYEDTATIYKLFLKSNKISYCNLSKYNYFYRNNSIMTSKFKIEKIDLINITDKMVSDILNEYPDLGEYGLKKKIQARFNVLSQLVFSDYYNSEITNEIIKYIQQNRKTILKSSIYTKKEKIASILLLNKRCFKIFWYLYKKNK